MDRARWDWTYLGPNTSSLEGILLSFLILKHATRGKAWMVAFRVHHPTNPARLIAFRVRISHATCLIDRADPCACWVGYGWWLDASCALLLLVWPAPPLISVNCTSIINFRECHTQFSIWQTKWHYQLVFISIFLEHTPIMYHVCSSNMLMGRCSRIMTKCAAILFQDAHFLSNWHVLNMDSVWW